MDGLCVAQVFETRINNRRVDEFSPAIAIQITPAEAMHHWICGNEMNLPGLFQACRAAQPLNLVGLFVLGVSKAARQRDFRPAVAVNVIGREINVLRRLGHGVLFPRGILEPIHPITLD